MTQADSDEFAKTAAIDFARRLVRHWQEALGTELLGAYLIGSLAHGGFSRRYSDIDVALVTTAGLSAQALDRLRSEALALSADWGPKVSVFWTDRHFSLGRFPPLDRVDYLDHAVALMERESVQPDAQRWKKFAITCAARRLRVGPSVREASRRLKRSSRRITRRICEHSSIPAVFATAG